MSNLFEESSWNFSKFLIRWLSSGNKECEIFAILLWSVNFHEMQLRLCALYLLAKACKNVEITEH